MPNYWIIRTDVTDSTLWHEMPRVEINRHEKTFLYRESWSVNNEDNPARYIKMRKNDIALLTTGTSDEKMVIGEIKFLSDTKEPYRHETNNPGFLEVGYFYDNVEVVDFTQAIAISDFTFSLPRIKEPKSLPYILRRVINSSDKTEYKILKEKKVFLARSIFYEAWFNLDDYFKRMWLLKCIEQGVDLYSDNYQMLAEKLLDFIQVEIGESLRMIEEMDRRWHSQDIPGHVEPVYLEIEGLKEYHLEPHEYSEKCKSLRQRQIFVEDIPFHNTNEQEQGYLIDIEVMKSLLEDGSVRENDSIFGGLTWTPIQLIA